MIQQLKYSKQVVHGAIVYHLLTDAQPVPQQKDSICLAKTKNSALSTLFSP